jgi:tRNA(Ile)-lysidine synthase
VLCRLKVEYNLTLHLAHLHHGLRGADADADADFVRALAADWHLACTVEQVDVPGLARKYRLAFEEAARRARYAFLSRVASTAEAQTIAVGHNADDQAETVLMHFIRGSGLAGLRGMLPGTPLERYRLFEGDRGRQTTEDGSRAKVVPQRPSSDLRAATFNLQLVRPLLEVTRAEIEAYCDQHGLEPRFDRSNLDTTYFRNWLRHEVLPLLAQHNPNVSEVMRRCSRVITDDYALLRSLLDETWAQVVLEESLAFYPPGPVLSGASGAGAEGGVIVFDLDAWRALPTALQRSTLREAIHRLRRSLRNINFLHVENALLVARDGTTGDKATLPQGLMLTVGYDRFTMTDAEAREAPPEWPLLQREAAPLPVKLPGDTALPDTDWIVRAEVLAWDDLTPEWAANPDRWQAFLDADATGPALWLRTRRPGDRFQPQGMEGHSVKLADFLTNQKVPRVVRDRLPLLVKQDDPQQAGVVVWVCGWRVDERARVHDETERVLVARFLRLDSLSH